MGINADTKLPRTSKNKALSGSKSQSQKQRFIETAKKLETDESGEAFEMVFAKIVPAKPKRPTKS